MTLEPTHVVTCHTEDRADPVTGEIGPCPSIDRPVPMLLTFTDRTTGEELVVTAVCGSCDGVIDDVVAINQPD